MTYNVFGGTLNLAQLCILFVETFFGVMLHTYVDTDMTFTDLTVLIHHRNNVSAVAV